MPHDSRRRIAVLGVPTRYGTSYPGSERTPSIVRRAGILDRLGAGVSGKPRSYDVVDVGDVALPVSPWHGDGFPLRALGGVRETAERQAARVQHLLQRGDAPLVIGGDCTTMLGSVAGLRRAGLRFGLVCFDAHGDFNTDQTTPSGNIHGMTVAAAAGRGAAAVLDVLGAGPAIPERRITLLGVRDLDPPEATSLAASAAAVLDPCEMRRRGLRESGELALDRALVPVAGWAPDGLLLHVDLDVLDPGERMGVGLPVPGGLLVDELIAALGPIVASGRVLAAELTEAAPALDPSCRTSALVDRLLGLLSRALGTVRIDGMAELTHGTLEGAYARA